jgi:hypothetical protein
LVRHLTKTPGLVASPQNNVVTINRHAFAWIKFALNHPVRGQCPLVVIRRGAATPQKNVCPLIRHTARNGDAIGRVRDTLYHPLRRSDCPLMVCNGGVTSPRYDVFSIASVAIMDCDAFGGVAVAVYHADMRSLQHSRKSILDSGGRCSKDGHHHTCHQGGT